MFFTQEEYDIRCEWAHSGVTQLASHSDAVVVVDVLSFSTCVDVAVAYGAMIYPFQWKDERADAYALANHAFLASTQRKLDEGYSLSPTSLLTIPADTRLVLPSPNGATLSLATGNVPTFAACLRNAQAVAAVVEQIGQHIAIIPAGEKWADGSLRPSVEDWIGAGAVIHHLPGTRSPEAQLAEGIFLQAEGHLADFLERCSSGKELIERGFGHDVSLSALLNVSTVVPVLINNTYYSNFKLAELI